MKEYPIQRLFWAKPNPSLPRPISHHIEHYKNINMRQIVQELKESKGKIDNIPWEIQYEVMTIYL